MAKLVYIDETGLNEKGANKQPLLTLVAVIVDEQTVKPLRDSMKQIVSNYIELVPFEFEYHAYDIWHGRNLWTGQSNTKRLEVFSKLVKLLDEHDIRLSHATINKEKLHKRYGGSADKNIYLLALQFLLEKINNLSDNKIIIADESKEHELKAVKMLSDLQDWGSGEVPGEQLKTIIDSLHFVRSFQSPGVQLADIIAYLLQRSRLESQHHPEADKAIEEFSSIIWSHCVTWRQEWPI